MNVNLCERRVVCQSQSGSSRVVMEVNEVLAASDVRVAKAKMLTVFLNFVAQRRSAEDWTDTSR